MEKVKDFAAYLAAVPVASRPYLEAVHDAIRAAAPEAEEDISYNMPAFKYKGRLVYFAAFKNHIGLYPLPSAIRQFSEQLKEYQTSKGAIQFPYNKPLPLKLIKAIVAFRVQENLSKAV